MRGKFISSLIILTFVISNSAMAIDTPGYDFDINDQEARLEYQRSIPVTQWPDNIPGGPVLYNEWKATVGDPGPFQIALIKTAETDMKGDVVPFVVIVNNTLYPSISNSVDIYLTDLTNEGYEPKLYTTSGGTPENLKAYLVGEYAAGMEGCLLIGDLPIPWYEETCWDDYTNFPIDLYYMDMDGVWDDYDDNGIYDIHTGDMGPEIWLGRLTAGPLNLGSHTEAELVNKYFAKNHEYRIGNSFLNNRSLVYIDDDWEYWDDQWSGNVGLAYNTRTTVSEVMTTAADDYEDYLDDNYESILVCVHSWPQGHSFKVGENWTSTHNYDIYNINPSAHFVNLFACSNSRYTAADYCGGWYIFADDHGLASVGCTKTGSMLHFQYFYGPFGEGRTMGQSLMDWFEVIASWGFPNNDLCWFYGMTLCGDPTLKHLEPPPVVIEDETIRKGYPGQYYCDTIGVSGGIPPYAWVIQADSLPAGLSLNSETGIIEGTPINIGDCPVTIRVEDSFVPPLYADQLYDLDIDQLCGDVNHDNQTNILDILEIISYLYSGGEMPQPYYIGDVDGGGVINILDITFYIDYLYNGGALLQCP